MAHAQSAAHCVPLCKWHAFLFPPSKGGRLSFICSCFSLGPLYPTAQSHNGLKAQTCTATAVQTLSISTGLSPDTFDTALQVQALVAEHKLGAAGRKLGMAMQKELINTPERLAKVQPPASSSWAAINKGKQKSRNIKQAVPTISRPCLGVGLDAGLDASAPATALSPAASVADILEEVSNLAVMSPAESQIEALDVAEEPTVHFLIPEAIEDTAEVSCNRDGLSTLPRATLRCYCI